ncbi:hypothetical protein V8C34DRAFT_300909 [Trichoderma compactum]
MARSTFRSVEEFARHNRTEHKDAISEDQIIDLQDTCHKIAPPNISQCPLCSWPQDEAIIPDATTKLEHVGNCIHEFSLNALPWAESLVEYATELLKPDIRRNIEEWLESNRETESADIQKIDIKTFYFIPTPPRLINQDTTFVPEEYFAESSISSQGTRRSPLLDLDLPGTIKTPPYDLPIRAPTRSWTSKPKPILRFSEEELDRYGTATLPILPEIDSEIGHAIIFNRWVSHLWKSPSETKSILWVLIQSNSNRLYSQF